MVPLSFEPLKFEAGCDALTLGEESPRGRHHVRRDLSNRGLQSDMNVGGSAQMRVIEDGEMALRRLFAAFVEQIFQADLGIADPSLTDYITEMLCRFVRFESLHRIRDTSGRRLEEVAEMLVEAEFRQSGPRREIYRHIGDMTLFWSGLYPEALAKLQSPLKKDHLIDYCEQGKRSYYLASTIEEARYADEAPVLRRLSEEFELCGIGLNRVRREWERFANKASGSAEAII